MRQEGKRFFFEKKKQKTCDFEAADRRVNEAVGRAIRKSLLVLFFRKERLALPETQNNEAAT
jgi:hypothetical protein